MLGCRLRTQTGNALQDLWNRMTRLLGPDVRLWGQRLAALEGTGPPPGLEPPEPPFGGKPGAPATTECPLHRNEVSGIASPGTRPKATGRTVRPSEQAGARRAALLAESRRSPDADDPGQKQEPRGPGSALVDDDGMDVPPSSDHLETLSAMS